MRQPEQVKRRRGDVEQVHRLDAAGRRHGRPGEREEAMGRVSGSAVAAGLEDEARVRAADAIGAQAA